MSDSDSKNNASKGSDTDLLNQLDTLPAELNIFILQEFAFDEALLWWVTGTGSGINQFLQQYPITDDLPEDDKERITYNNRYIAQLIYDLVKKIPRDVRVSRILTVAAEENVFAYGLPILVQMIDVVYEKDLQLAKEASSHLGQLMRSLVKEIMRVEIFNVLTSISEAEELKKEVSEAEAELKKAESTYHNIFRAGFLLELKGALQKNSELEKRLTAILNNSETAQEEQLDNYKQVLQEQFARTESLLKESVSDFSKIKINQRLEAVSSILVNEIEIVEGLSQETIDEFKSTLQDGLKSIQSLLSIAVKEREDRVINFGKIVKEHIAAGRQTVVGNKEIKAGQMVIDSVVAKAAIRLREAEVYKDTINKQWIKKQDNVAVIKRNAIIKTQLILQCAQLVVQSEAAMNNAIPEGKSDEVIDTVTVAFSIAQLATEYSSRASTEENNSSLEAEIDRLCANLPNSTSKQAAHEARNVISHLAEVAFTKTISELRTNERATDTKEISQGVRTRIKDSLMSAIPEEINNFELLQGLPFANEEEPSPPILWESIRQLTDTVVESSFDAAVNAAAHDNFQRVFSIRPPTTTLNTHPISLESINNEIRTYQAPELTFSQKERSQILNAALINVGKNCIEIILSRYQPDSIPSSEIVTAPYGLPQIDILEITLRSRFITSDQLDRIFKLLDRKIAKFHHLENTSECKKLFELVDIIHHHRNTNENQATTILTRCGELYKRLLSLEEKDEQNQYRVLLNKSDEERRSALSLLKHRSVELLESLVQSKNVSSDTLTHQCAIENEPYGFPRKIFLTAVVKRSHITEQGLLSLLSHYKDFNPPQWLEIISSAMNSRRVTTMVVETMFKQLAELCHISDDPFDTYTFQSFLKQLEKGWRPNEQALSMLFRRSRDLPIYCWHEIFCFIGRQSEASLSILHDVLDYAQYLLPDHLEDVMFVIAENSKTNESIYSRLFSLFKYLDEEQSERVLSRILRNPNAPIDAILHHTLIDTNPYGLSQSNALRVILRRGTLTSMQHVNILEYIPHLPLNTWADVLQDLTYYQRLDQASTKTVIRYLKVFSSIDSSLLVRNIVRSSDIGDQHADEAFDYLAKWGDRHILFMLVENLPYRNSEGVDKALRYLKGRGRNISYRGRSNIYYSITHRETLTINQFEECLNEFEQYDALTNNTYTRRTLNMLARCHMANESALDSLILKYFAVLNEEGKCYFLAAILQNPRHTKAHFDRALSVFDETIGKDDLRSSGAFLLEKIIKSQFKDESVIKRTFDFYLTTIEPPSRAGIIVALVRDIVNDSERTNIIYSHINSLPKEHWLTLLAEIPRESIQPTKTKRIFSYLNYLYPPNMRRTLYWNEKDNLIKLLRLTPIQPDAEQYLTSIDSFLRLVDPDDWKPILLSRIENLNAEHKLLDVTLNYLPNLPLSDRKELAIAVIPKASPRQLRNIILLLEETFLKEDQIEVFDAAIHRIPNLGNARGDELLNLLVTAISYADIEGEQLELLLGTPTDYLFEAYENATIDFRELTSILIYRGKMPKYNRSAFDRIT